MAHFLDALPLTDSDLEKVRSLGVNTPFALLAMRKASPQAFDAFIGAELADDLSRRLEPLLTDEDRAQLQAPASPAGGLGARLPPKPE